MKNIFRKGVLSHRVFSVILSIALVLSCASMNMTVTYAEDGENPPTESCTPTISTQPANVTVYENNTATFAVVASSEDGGTLSYQWQILNTETESWDNIEGKTEATFVYNNVNLEANGSKYKCKVTNTLGENAPSDVCSSEVTLSVNPKNDAPAAPNCVIIPPTMIGGNDGKITGVDTSMEYSTDGTHWSNVSGTEITGLSEGSTIHVRVKETEDTKVGTAVILTVPTYLRYEDVKAAIKGKYVLPVDNNTENDKLIEVTDAGIKFAKRSEIESASGATIKTIERMSNSNIKIKCEVAGNEKLIEFSVIYLNEEALGINIVLDSETYEREFVISYTLNGGAWVDGYEPPVRGTSKEYVSLPDYTNIAKKGYIFTGWSNGIEKNIVGLSVWYKDVAFVAHFAKEIDASLITVYTTSGVGNNDGKITGVDSSMEYSANGESWNDITGTDITGLAVGTYCLRYKAADYLDAGPNLIVNITDPHIHRWVYSKSGNKLIAKSLCHNEEDCWHRSEVQVVKELTISVNGNINSGSTPTVTTGTDAEKGAWVESGLYNPTEEEVKFYASTGVGSTTKTGDALSSAPDKAGNYVVEYTYSGDVAATNVPVAVAFTINKIDPTATAPTAVNSLTYTGSDLTLVSAGSTSDGTIQYALSLEGPFSATLPKAMNAGTYSVYYKVVGDSEHNDKVFTTPVSVTVSKKTQEAIAKPSIAEAGINRVKVNVPTDDRAGTIKYIQAASTPNANAAGWSPSPTITGLSAGTTYTVYVMFSGDENHEPVISAGESVTTEKPAATQPTGLDAVGPTVEGGTDGKITELISSKKYQYSTNGTAWTDVTADSTEIIGLASGTYFVRVAADASYSASNSVEIFVPVTSSSSPVVSEVESTISGEVVSEVETESLGDIAKELAEEETSGEKVEVKLEVKTQTEISDNSIKQSITNLLDKIVQAAIRVVTYLEIDINKIVGNGGSSSVEETSKVIEIVISVSSKTVNNNPVVVRNHGGVSVTFNKVDAKPTSNFIDGTFYIDKENCKIYIYTKYFSDYALVSAEGHTVTLESNGGSTENAIIVDNGGRVTTLPTPTKSGYTFGGWYTDNSTFNNRFTTSTTVNDDITVYAKWVSNTPGGGGGNSGNTTPGNNTPSTPAQVAPVTEIKAVSVGGYSLNSWDSIAAAATKISAQDVKKANSSKEALLQVDISSSSNKEIPKDVVQLIKKSNLDGLHVFVGEGDAVTFVKDENYSKYNGMSFSHKDTVTANSRTIDFVNKGNLNAKVVFHTVAAPSKTVELYKVVKGKEVKIGTLVTTKEGRICFEISELATYILKY